MDDEKLLVPVRQDIVPAYFRLLLGATPQNVIVDRPCWEWAMLLRAIKSACERCTTALGTDLGIVARIAVGGAAPQKGVIYFLAWITRCHAAVDRSLLLMQPNLLV